MKQLWIALFTACLSLAFVGSAYSADQVKKDKKAAVKKDETKTKDATKKKKEKDTAKIIKLPKAH